MMMASRLTGRRAVALGMAVALAWITPVAAANPATTPILPAEAVAMASVASPRLSPDGKRLVHEQTRTDWQANRIVTQLWLVDTASGATRPLTRGDRSAGDAAWSPDGRWIAFLSDRGASGDNGQRQLFIMPADGGDAVAITTAPAGVQAFDWSPDGRWIAYLAAGERPAGLKARDKAFGAFRIVRGDSVPVQLWRVEVDGLMAGTASAAPPPRALTPATGPSATALDIAPDGRHVAIAAQATPELAVGETSDIYSVSSDGGALVQITRGGGPNRDPLWSPDGRWIAFVTADGARNSFFANARLARVPADGGAVTVLTRGFDEDARPAFWQADGLHFTARAGTQAGLWRIAPDSGAISRVALGEASIATGFSRSSSGALAFIGSAANRVPEVMLMADGRSRALTNMAAQWQGKTVSVREVVSWTSSDGTRIEGILHKPADFDPAKRYPLLVIIHGGPTGIDLPDVRADRIYPAEWWVARGALVLRPNYRGSAGYGGKFRALNYRNLGLGDYADVISGVDMLIARGMVDPARVAAMGWSQGGYISAFITTFSTRFKAVSVGAGISDWMTYYIGTDITPFTRQYLGATPWSDPDIYRRTSPITYVNKARTPTLIQHGSNDARVPIANAYELRLALEDRGVPVKMVVYDGFGHSINKPRQMAAVLAENLGWFNHHVWGDPLPADVDPANPALVAAEPAK